MPLAQGTSHLSDVATLFQEFGQRRATRKSSMASIECRIDSAPGLVRACHLTRVLFRPVARRGPVCVGPCQNLIDSQRRKVLFVSDATVLGQQFGQR
jgi:hypothetical protein